MWTLRDLWFLLNPDAEDEWRQNKAKEMTTYPIKEGSFGPDGEYNGWSRPMHDGDGGGLREILRYRNSQITDSPSLKDILTTPQQNYGIGMNSGWYRHKYPPKYKGLI